MVDMATSETCGAFARGYGIRRFEGVGYHIAAVIGWLLCGFLTSQVWSRLEDFRAVHG